MIIWHTFIFKLFITTILIFCLLFVEWSEAKKSKKSSLKSKKQRSGAISEPGFANQQQQSPPEAQVIGSLAQKTPKPETSTTNDDDNNEADDETGVESTTGSSKATAETRSTSYNRQQQDSCIAFLPLAGSRKCARGCTSGFTCRNEKRRCLCDGVCGRSCVIPNRPCVKPRIDFGRVEVLPYNRFGAEAVYSCNNGYVLSGPSRRICQGDGQWSDEEPRCEREVMCTAPPVVRQAFHNGFPEDENARYSIGTQIRYTCLPGYQMYGFPKAMCLAGRWMGPRLVCSPRNCGDPGALLNGRSEGSLFYYGHSVVYICDSGYDIQGDSFRKCQANGTWSGQPPRCVAIQCPQVYAPTNGQIAYQNTSVGGLVKITCHSGYLLQGDEERVCQRDRRWSGRRPNCTKIECGEIGHLPNGRVIYTGSGLGAVAYFRCDPNAVASPVTAPQRAVCLREGQWSDPPPQCLANCRITFSADGSLLVNGTRPSPYQYTLSSQIVHVTCNQTGFRLFPSLPYMLCHNGSWVDASDPKAPAGNLPTCQPLSCTDPPPSIENGLIRWRPSTHGERAFYVCIPGYVLAGNDSATCLYGQWQSTGPALPQCRESFCSYPGPLQNGDIIILGRFGLYEFTPEVTKLRHGEQIEFVCKPDYRLIGSRKATCVNGRWSPAFKPLCIQNNLYFNTNNPSESDISHAVASNLGQQQKPPVDSKSSLMGVVKGVQLYRHRRDAIIIEFSENCEAILSAEYRRVESVNSFKVQGEQITEQLQSPSILQHEQLLSQENPNTSQFDIQRPADDLQSSVEVNLTANADPTLSGTSKSITLAETVRINCPPGYKSVPPDGLASCISGKWYPTVPSCIKIQFIEAQSSPLTVDQRSGFNKKKAQAKAIREYEDEDRAKYFGYVNTRPSYYGSPYQSNMRPLEEPRRSSNSLLVVKSSDSHHS